MSWQATAWVESNPQIITQMDYCVMINLANWANDRNEWSPSYSTWAKASRCSVVSVRRAVDRLEAAGVITVIGRGANKANTYRINMPGTSLPGLKPDAAEDVVMHAIEQESKRARLFPPAHGEHLPAHPDEHLPAHGEHPAPAHDEHLPAHPDEHLPAHLDEQRIITTTSNNPVPDTKLTPEQIRRNLDGLDAMRRALTSSRCEGGE